MIGPLTIGIESEPRREVKVVVYDTVAALRAAATRFDNRTASRKKRQRGRYADTLGLCQRFELEDEHGRQQPLCAIVRLARQHLGAGIVSHEMAHAALQVWMLDHPDERLTDSNDEPYAWVLGELVRRTVNWLHDHGVYDQDEGD